MVDEHRDLPVLRKYLLGTLDDDEAARTIEKRLMEDEGFIERLDLAEEHLIEEYLDGSLGEEEAGKFERFFLSHPDRVTRLRLIRNLRMIAGAEGRAAEEKPRGSFNLRQLLSVRWLVPVSAMAAVLLFGIIAAWLWTGNSDTRAGLAQLNIAYSGQRPVQARLTVMPDYRPFTETRGAQSEVTDRRALDRAQRYLLDASARGEDADAHHALGVYYLLSDDFERAESELSRAVNLDPNNARIRNDLGAAYLERAEESAARGDGAKALNLLNEALKHFEAAVQVDPRMLDPRFNLALCLEMLSNAEQAKAAWREYLQLDPRSKWADEAERHLERLESRGAAAPSAEEIESNFLKAFKEGNDDVAGRLISDNRELITGKYIPQRLAMSLVRSGGETRGEFLKALQYSARLELSRTGDPFAKEIADRYSKASEHDIVRLQRAQEHMSSGYKFCLSQNYANALTSFRSAKALFDEAGGSPESKLAQYFVAYALINSRQNESGLRELEEVRKYTATHGYSWLGATVTYWIGNSHVIARRPTEARQAFERALGIARSLGDRYATQRNTLQLASLHSSCGQFRESLAYLAQILIDPASAPPSRQRYRNLSEGHAILARAGLLHTSKAAATESVMVADILGDSLFVAQSRNYLGVSLAELGNFEEARRWLQAGRDRAMSIGDVLTREKLIAFSDLKFGAVEIAQGNYAAAADHYTAAVRYYDNVDLPFNQEEAHIGLLRTYLKRGDLEMLEKEIPENIRLVEEYRSRLSGDDQRIGYFGARESVYDIASRFEFGRGNYEKAYDYAEMASARSLLDWMHTGETDKLAVSAKVEADAEARPLSLPTIRQNMPAGAQLIQYSVWEDGLVVWFISGRSFDFAAVPTGADELKREVSLFRDSIRDAHADDTKRLGRSLYEKLILPIRDNIDPEKPVCIVPAEGIFDLPFAALVSEKEDWLISELTIHYSPSANVFLRSTENAKRRAPLRNESLLAVGDPAFDRISFKDLAYLKDASGEVEEIRELYGGRAEVLLREDATKFAFLERLPKANVVHFAGHYVPVPALPNESHLVMAPGRNSDGQGELTNRELSNLRLPNAKLLILAACRTGTESYRAGEGVIGISRTFLGVDVPLVVASFWDVESGSTAKLMRLMHGYRRNEGMPTALALRRAQLNLISEFAGEAYSDPKYWAAFGVFGGHAEF